jgi:CheY-like chemotaxis protein
LNAHRCTRELRKPTRADLGHFHPARTADAALQVAQRVAPDLVLLNLHMPDTDDFELCRKLRADAERRAVGER